MTRARKHIVCVDETPYYHVTTRCVRRAFLCGIDHYSGRDYEHRRDWVEQRIRVLSSVFSIDVAAYAVMSNHYPLVDRLAPEQADDWTDDEVLRRWGALHKGQLLVRRYLGGETLTPAEAQAVAEAAAVYRKRLKNLSWFMKALNEPIARKANAEDGCSGHFWEARFHSEALTSDEAVIRAMAYVDLNPVRAGIAETPEKSDFTSFKARAQPEAPTSSVGTAVAAMFERSELTHRDIAARPLMPFADEDSDHSTERLPIARSDYFLLVDATARYVVSGKRGHMQPELPSITERLGLSPEDWVESMSSPRRVRRETGVRSKQA